MTTTHLPVVSLLVLSSCAVETSTGPAHTETFEVERDSSEFLRVNVNMKAGELQLSGGAAKFAEGRVTCTVERCKPLVKYSSVAGRGNLSIEQPSSSMVVGDAKYRWDLRLPDDVPVDLAVDLGAGEANLDAGGLLLRSVEVRMGAGRLDMDLRGDIRRDCDVKVRGGVGEAVIRLPKDVGIYATATGALGSINATGLRKEGDHWSNDAYENARRTIRVDVQGGVGEIRLIADD